MLELAERAKANALKLTALATSSKKNVVPPFAPKNYDTRFDHPGWQKTLIQLWQQGFLAAQDWWDYATDPLRGLRQEDTDRTRFTTQQVLDVVSPSNFSWLNPERLCRKVLQQHNFDRNMVVQRSRSGRINITHTQHLDALILVKHPK